MESESLPTEVILTHPHQSLGKLALDWTPQPGNYLELQGTTYAVLERHQHYQYKVGGYILQKISVHVQKVSRPSEKTLIEGRWILGDASCSYNARSEILRCAVNPDGPCAGCRFYEQRGDCR
jgi:hypothetical protein